MNKLKMLSVAFAGASLLLVAGPLRPARAWTPTYIDTSKVVVISTIPSKPTQILAAVGSDAYVKVRLEWSGTGTKPNGEYLLLSDSTVAISTSATVGSARIPASTLNNEWYDLGLYRGALYGVEIGTNTPQLVSVIRIR